MRRLLTGLVAVLMIGFALPARADRGAFSLEGGGIVSAARVPPGMGTGESVFGTMGGATLGVRYALDNNLELTASGVWTNPVPFHNNDTTVVTSSSPFTGQLYSEVNRVGAAVGADWVTGLVFRFHAGVEAGWSRIAFTNLNLVDAGVALGSRNVDGIVLAPRIALQWMATDNLSFAVSPRVEFMLGEPQMTAFSTSITASYSWYGWFRR